MFSHEVRSDQEQEIQEPSDEIWNASCASNSLYMVWYSNTVIQWLIDFFMQSIQVFFFQSLWMSHKMHRKRAQFISSQCKSLSWGFTRDSNPNAYGLPAVHSFKAGHPRIQSEKVTWRAVMRWEMMEFWCWNFAFERTQGSPRSFQGLRAWSCLISTSWDREGKGHSSYKLMFGQEKDQNNVKDRMFKFL